MPLSAVRYVVIGLCGAGIVGMIVASVAGNNNGWVITFGLVAVVSIVVLMAFSAASRTAAAAASGLDETVAERVEQQIRSLVETGADETAVRDLVRDAVRLGRGK
jgi:predicted MFS family arabinose efflux permease